MLFCKKKDLNINNKMLSLIIHAGKDGNDHCKKKIKKN